MSPKKILIVEDEELLREMLKDFLEDKGCRLALAASLREGLEHLEADPCDIVITDLQLTGLKTEGFQILTRAKAVNPETKVIVMTGIGSEEAQIEAYEKGADIYIEKPINLMVLRGFLKKFGVVDDDDDL